MEDSKQSNFFFIGLGLKEEQRFLQINNVAESFTAELFRLDKVTKTLELYFIDISQSVIKNIAVVCMLARNIEGRQTNFAEIKKCVDDFDEIEKYIKIIEENFNMAINGEPKSEENELYYDTIYEVKSKLLGESRERMYDLSRGLRSLLYKSSQVGKF